MNPCAPIKGFLAFIVALLLVLAGILIQGCARVYTFEEPRACMAPSVLSVGTASHWMGSAVAIGATQAYTAAHVVDDLKSVEVIEVACDTHGLLDYGQSHTMKVATVDEDRDLALLELSDNGPSFTHYVALRGAPVEQGDLVYLHGVRTHGRPAVVHDYNSALAENAVRKGDSGGAVLDTRGRLVGIIRGGLCLKQNLCSVYIRDDQDSFGRFVELFSGVVWAPVYR